MTEEAHRVTTAAEKSDVDFRKAKRSVVRCDQNVGRSDDRQTRAQGRAVDCDDHGLRALPNRMKALARSSKMHHQCPGRIAQILSGLEICACTKDFASGREHDGADLRILTQAIEGFRQFIVELASQRVDGWRVDRDHRYVIRLADSKTRWLACGAFVHVSLDIFEQGLPAAVSR